MKIKILDTENNRKNDILRGMIGSKWNVEKIDAKWAKINCCGGMYLFEGEYEVVE